MGGKDAGSGPPVWEPVSGVYTLATAGPPGAWSFERAITYVCAVMSHHYCFRRSPGYRFFEQAIIRLAWYCNVFAGFVRNRDSDSLNKRAFSLFLVMSTSFFVGFVTHRDRAQQFGVREEAQCGGGFRIT